ncbi:MAG: putative sulfate exporter family transporter [Terracidiphilus sp.]
MARNAFFIGIILCASGFVSPPLALALGLVYAFVFVHPLHTESRHLARFLLQISVVGIGFGMDLRQVLRAGSSGFVYTAGGIAFALLLGWGLGKLLRVPATTSFLISTGTAICGGSAIAAVAPICNAGEEEIAVSLGTVFVLNSIALLLFPPIGWALRMTQTQFGLWAALAIHDTSSVVGASARFGALALSVGTTVKLARALWIVPVSLATAAVRHSKVRVQWPWFILFFLLAALANTFLPVFHSLYPNLRQLGILGLTVTLFLIGSGLSKQTLRRVGIRPLLQGVLLWCAVAVTSLALIRAGWIHL